MQTSTGISKSLESRIQMAKTHQRENANAVQTLSISDLIFVFGFR